MLRKRFEVMHACETEEISLETTYVSCYRGKKGCLIKKSVLRFACCIVITYSLSIISGEIRWTVKWQISPNHPLLLSKEMLVQYTKRTFRKVTNAAVSVQVLLSLIWSDKIISSISVWKSFNQTRWLKENRSNQSSLHRVKDFHIFFFFYFKLDLDKNDIISNLDTIIKCSFYCLKFQIIFITVSRCHFTSVGCLRYWT